MVQPGTPPAPDRSRVGDEPVALPQVSGHEPPEALLRALAGASESDQAALALREVVCAYVAGLRTSGAPPERTLVLVKGVLARAGLVQARGPRRDALFDRIIRWCIEEYYRAD